MLALLFKNSYLFYSIAIAITLLLSVAGGAIIPLDNLIGKYPWIPLVNPLYDFLHGTINYHLPAICILVIVSWYYLQQRTQVDQK
ncbi:hypothetical protein RWE15_24830 [Virgibacillus halophilus]|uniref:Uncharacterized protein n=1 Tax=Tigheibacillus halophilus TaxID=361280 RepID=A0ABU5CEH8_9BACI|nr:hypothetical protein [Virgibacillus halophilus]